MFSHPGCQDGFFRALLLLRQKTRGVLSKTPLGQKCQPGVFKKVVEVGRSTLQSLTIIIIHILMEVRTIVVKVLTCKRRKEIVY